MANTLLTMATNLEAMASNLEAIAFNLIAMGSNLVGMQNHKSTSAESQLGHLLALHSLLALQQAGKIHLDLRNGKANGKTGANIAGNAKGIRKD